MRKMVNTKITQWVDAKFKPLGEPEGELVDDLVKKGILSMSTVSYTHLDVYKRQPITHDLHNAPLLVKSLLLSL